MVDTRSFSQILMAKPYIIILIFFLMSVAFVTLPLTAEAATLYLSPSSGSHYKGENFKINILVSSDIAINGVSGVLDFPTQYIKVVSIDKGNSVLNFWVEEPSFSNASALGNIRFEGVALNPGFMGNGQNIATITFRADWQGTADLNFSQWSILANDGLGTDVNASIIGAHFTLLPQRVSPAPIQIQSDSQKPQVIFVKELSQMTPSFMSSFWEALPDWVKISVAVTIGLATLMFTFIILSLGAMEWTHFIAHLPCSLNCMRWTPEAQTA